MLSVLINILVAAVVLAVVWLIVRWIVKVIVAKTQGPPEVLTGIDIIFALIALVWILMIVTGPGRVWVVAG